MPPEKTPTCPNDGSDLVAVDGDSVTPPWLCEPCVRLWWPSELTEGSRAAWDPKTRAYARGERGAMARLLAQHDRDQRRRDRRPPEKG